MKYGRLTVISDGPRWKGRTTSHCVCDCGNHVVVKNNNLRTGNTHSCGCLRQETKHNSKNLKHGESSKGPNYSNEYVAWRSMLQRCYDPNHIGYPRYGGANPSVEVYAKWRTSFEEFLQHVGRRPTSSHSLDRFPNNKGNYEPGNVRWATKTEQNRNTNQNRIIEWNGKAQCMAAWAEDVGLPYHVLSLRMNSGRWTVEKALTTPKRKRTKCGDG